MLLGLSLGSTSEIIAAELGSRRYFLKLEINLFLCVCVLCLRPEESYCKWVCLLGFGQDLRGPIGFNWVSTGLQWFLYGPLLGL